MVAVQEVSEVKELARIFKALSVETRLRILKAIEECQSESCASQDLCVNAIADKVGISQSAVSQHLTVLKNAGLVIDERKGYYIHYSINKGRFGEFKRMVEDKLGTDFI
ncbi:MAG: ArsR/SmtB family transcription factor [bacterium]